METITGAISNQFRHI